MDVHAEKFIDDAAWSWGSILLWAIVGLAINLLQTPIWNSLGLFGGLVFATHVFWGLWLAFRMPSTKNKQGRWLFGALALLVLSLFYLAGGTVIRDLGDRLRFEVHRDNHDRIVALAAAGSLLEEESNSVVEGAFRGTRYIIAADNGELVAFPRDRIGTDIRVSVVFDKTDTIEGLHEGQMANSDLALVLRGKPLSCRAFARPHYFRCIHG